MKKPMSRKEAKALGYVVNTTSYPWTGQNPDGIQLQVLTDKEHMMLEALRKAHVLLDDLNDGGFGPLVSLEGLNVMSAVIDAIESAENED